MTSSAKSHSDAQEITAERFAFYPRDLIGLPAKEWLIEGVLGKGDICVLTGERNVGKTFVALWLATKLAAGAQLFPDGPAVKNKCRVVYACGEKWSGVPNRILTALEQEGMVDTDRVVATRGVPHLFRKDGLFAVHSFVERLRRECDQKIDLLIIDTLSVAGLGMDENASKDMNEVIDSVRSLQACLDGCTVLLIHHPPKGSSKGTRGSGALEGAADTVLGVRASRGSKMKCELHCEKQGDADYFAPMLLSLKASEQRESLSVRLCEALPTQSGNAVGLKRLGVPDQIAQVVRAAGGPISFEDLNKSLGGGGTLDSVRMAVGRYNKRKNTGGSIKTIVRRKGNPNYTWIPADEMNMNANN